MHEVPVAELQPTSGVFPAQVKREPVDGLTVAQALQPLQHHHHGNDSRRHRGPANLREQIGEPLVWEQSMALPVQEAVNRRRRDVLLAETGASAKNVLGGRRLAQRHARIRSSALDERNQKTPAS